MYLTLYENGALLGSWGLELQCYMCTVIFQNWNRKELWDSSRANTLLQLVLTLHNIECRFIIIPRPYSNNLRLRIITHSDCFTVPCSSSIDFFKVAASCQ